MKYQSKSTIAYLLRNFWRLAPFAIPSALTLGYFLNVGTEISFAGMLISGKLTQDNVNGALMQAISVSRFGGSWWCVILVLVLFAFTESLLTLKVERNMRVGEMPIFPIREAITVFPTIALFVLCVTLGVEIFNLIIVGVAYLIRNASAVAIGIVGFSLLYVTKAIVTLAVGALLMAFPIILLEHYSLGNALSYSVRLMNENRRFLWFFAIVYPISRLAFSVLCYFAASEIVTVLVFSAFYLIVMLVLPCLTFKLYYDVAGGERRDIGVKMF